MAYAIEMSQREPHIGKTALQLLSAQLPTPEASSQAQREQGSGTLACMTLHEE